VPFRKFQHENLVKLYGVSTQQGPIFIVQELMVNGKWSSCRDLVTTAIAVGIPVVFFLPNAGICLFITSVPKGKKWKG